MTSCVATYNQGHYENLTKLKAYHSKFLDDFTVSPQNKFSTARLNEYREEGDLKFREAEEYAEPIGDENRLKGLAIVRDLYSTHVGDVSSDGALMSPTFAEQRKEVTEANYSAAIKGELSRMGAPATKKSNENKAE